MKKYNHQSPDSILDYAKKLKDKTLREACAIEIENHKIKGKGNFGQILEKYYFGYGLNSNSEPDFPEAGIELKTSPLKVLKNKSIRSKERLVLNIINYLEVHKEEFESSSFWKKNAHLLTVFYLHDGEIDMLDYIIKLVDEWKFPESDLKVIKNDWETIKNKIKAGQAHEISEGDTFYLGACTKGSTAEKSLRQQPFSKIKAKQRAYSLKQGYVNHIIANIAKEETAVYGKIIKHPEILNTFQSIEDIVISKFKRFYGKSSEEIEMELGLDLNQSAKHYFSNLTNAILGIELGKKIEEFEKANIQVKTVRIMENNLPKESISFPTFEYNELINTDWEDSEFKNILESKFFFVFYKYEEEKLILKRVKFWNMPSSDILEAKCVWDVMVSRVSNGDIVKEITKKGLRKTYFPKSKENRISHVRPHAKNAADTYKLPIADRLTGVTEYTKHCFWLNSSYVRTEIFDK